jgi:hypothetical protein
VIVRKRFGYGFEELSMKKPTFLKEIDNVILQAQSLKPGTVTMAGFQDEDVRKVLNL